MLKDSSFIDIRKCTYPNLKRFKDSNIYNKYWIIWPLTFAGRHHSGDSSDQNGSTPHDPPASPVPMQFGQSNGSIPGASGRRNAGSKLFMQRWRAMFFKRLLHSRRYKASIVSQLIMPGIWTILAMVAAKIIPKPTDSPARTLSTAMFQDNYVPFSQHGW